MKEKILEKFNIYEEDNFHLVISKSNGDKISSEDFFAILKEYYDWKIKECLPERKAGTPIKKPKLGRPRKYKSVEVSTYNPYEDGWNACIDQIISNKDKK